MAGKILVVAVVLGLAICYAYYLFERTTGQSFWQWCDEWADEETDSASAVGLDGGAVPFAFVVGTISLMMLMYPVSTHLISLVWK